VTAYGERVTGVILSGGLDDGTHGSMLIKQHKGVVIVQSPEEAVVPSMPLSVLRNVEVDYVLPVAEMAGVISKLAGHFQEKDESVMTSDRTESYDVAEGLLDPMRNFEKLGPPSPFSCPECGGTLWEVSEDATRFRCHVGHAYSLRTLAAEQGTQLEAALWAALRRLEESERISERMAHQARVHGNASSARYHEDVSRSTAHHAEVLRGLLASITDRAADVPQEG